jgi:hypothetical protein
MNAILKDALKAAERLSPEDQKTLAAEIEKRAYELWLDAELAKGEASGGDTDGRRVRSVEAQVWRLGAFAGRPTRT